jgi:hypothetical protein
MRLSDLKPRFYKHSVEPAGKGHGRPLPDGTIQWGGFPVDTFSVVENIADADRVSFLCPKCFSDNGGKVGTHRVAIDFIGRGTPDDARMHNDHGQPVRWSFQGSSLEDLTLGPSILILHGCAWHGFVEQGGIRTC